MYFYRKSKPKNMECFCHNITPEMIAKYDMSDECVQEEKDKCIRNWKDAASHQIALERQVLKEAEQDELERKEMAEKAAAAAAAAASYDDISSDGTISEAQDSDSERSRQKTV